MQRSFLSSADKEEEEEPVVSISSMPFEYCSMACLFFPSEKNSLPLFLKSIVSCVWLFCFCFVC